MGTESDALHVQDAGRRERGGTPDDNLCIYCGVRAASTRDHVPPKAIFPRPRPSDLISAPACDMCNGGSSRLDEEFAFWLSWYVGRRSPTTAQLFEERAMRTGEHNRRIGERILDVAKHAEVHTAAGIYLGNVVAISWDSAPYIPIIQRIVRGLYHHHHGVALNPVRGVDARLLAARPVLNPPLALSIHEVGKGQFRYGHCFNDSDPESSFWILEFHGRVWAIASTLRDA